MKLRHFLTLIVPALLVSEASHAAMITFNGTSVSSPNDHLGTNLAGSRYSAILVDLDDDGFGLNQVTTRIEGEAVDVGSLLGGDLILTVSPTQTSFGGSISGNTSFDSENAFTYNIQSKSFSVVWFETMTSGATVTSATDYYGLVTDGSWVIPSNPLGGTYTFGSSGDFSQVANPSATTGIITAIPEPSSFLVLAGLGFLGLLRRRVRR